MPEPAIQLLDTASRPPRRPGAVLYGALAARKGIDLLAHALSLRATPLRLIIAGEPDQAFRPTLEKYVAQMRTSGVDVDLRAFRHDEREGLVALASATCAVLPYPNHDGMSRVLVEACAVGTPVVVHERGLLGHLVRKHRIGLAVDCRDPNALREAVVRLARGGTEVDAYRAALARFAGLFSYERFAAAILEPFTKVPVRRQTSP